MTVPKCRACSYGHPLECDCPQKFDHTNVQAFTDWGLYQKVAPTRAKRINGPFAVQTKEGPLYCPDGWLALDSSGWPYPISVSDFAEMYRKADSS